MPLTATTRGWLRVGCAVGGVVLFAALVVSHWNKLDGAADDRLYGYAEGSVERLWISERWQSDKNKTKLLVPTIVYRYSVGGRDYTGTTWLKPAQNGDEFNRNSNAEWAARISTYLTRYAPGLDAARRPLSSAPPPVAYPLLPLPYERDADDTAAPPILVKYRSAEPGQSAVYFHPLLVDLIGVVVLAHLVAAAASAGVLLLRDNAAERNRHPVASNADGSATLHSSALTSGDIWPVCLAVAGLSAVALPLLYGPFVAAYPPGVANPLRFGLAPALLAESVVAPLLVAATGVYFLLRWLWMHEPVLTVRNADGCSFRAGDALVVAVSQRLQRTLTVQSLALTVACCDTYTVRHKGKSKVKTTVVSSATRTASAWTNRLVPAGDSVAATFDDVQIPDPGAPARGVYSWSITYTLSVAHAPDYSADYPIFPLLPVATTTKKKKK